MDKQFITKNITTADEIKKTRKKLGLTQKEFATLVGISKPTIERWETSENEITGPIAALLPLLTKDYLEQNRIPQKRKPLRMWYMFNDSPCTLIDVDDREQEVEIKNYINNYQFRAFGCNEHPTYEEYQEFLESRCFPRSRDKMKLILEDLNLPFYEPYLIVKKTQGRMAEDHFWIKIEE